MAAASESAEVHEVHRAVRTLLDKAGSRAALMTYLGFLHVFTDSHESRNTIPILLNPTQRVKNASQCMIGQHSAFDIRSSSCNQQMSRGAPMGKLTQQNQPTCT
jgi:hypothetical protein